jgi:thioredoxin reductase (NADPH)
MNHYSLIIIGSGPAGYTAAIYSARAQLKPLLITGNQPGGQLTTTTVIDNWPGSVDGIDGSDLMINMKNHAQKYGTIIIDEHIEYFDYKDNIITLSNSNNTYTCDSLIIATGATPRFLGLKEEKKFLGYGLSTCATCDGVLYINKKIIIVGGGNTAIEEALYMSNLGSNIVIIHRRSAFRAEKILIDQLMQQQKIKKNITIEWDTIVEEILGDSSGVTGIRIKNLITKKIQTISISAVFIAIGHIPNTKIFKDKVLIDNEGYIVTRKDSLTATNINSIFAAGDVIDKKYKQAITASAMGCMAAIDVEKFLEKQKLLNI